MERNVPGKFIVMVNIIHAPIENSNNRYQITGSDIEELIEYCIHRVRQISKKYYEKELRIDLEKNSKSSIDVHAGMGTSYEIILIK